MPDLLDEIGIPQAAPTAIAPQQQPARTGGDLFNEIGIPKPVAPLQPDELPQTAPKPVQAATPISELVPQLIQKVQADPISDPLTDKPETGFADIFTGAERIAATPELGTLPDFPATKEGDTFKIALGMLSTFDPKAQLDIIKEAIPEAKFEQTPDGSTIIEVPGEDGKPVRSVLNRPGFSTQDFQTALGQAVAFIPAAKIASLGRTLAQKVGLAGAAAGATEQALQETGVELGRTQRDPLATGLATALGPVGEVVGPAVVAVREGRRAAKAGIARESLGQVEPAIKQAEEAVEAVKGTTGQEVGLFQAQKTQTPSELVQQRIIPQLEAGSKTAAEALKKQNQEAFDATAGLIRSIAPDEVVATGSQRFRDAAKLAVDQKRINRTLKTSPIFKQAFRRQRQGETPPINTKDIESKIEGIIRGSDETGQVASNLKNVTNKIKLADGNLQKLQSVKIEIDNLIDGRGDSAVGKATKRFLTSVKSDLVNSMESQSPSFKSAMDEFRRLSPEVNAIENQIVGQIAKIPDDRLKSVSSKIFDPTEINPKVLADAKKVIQSVDPGAWDDLVRVELERRFGGLKNFISEQGEESIANIPGQIDRAIFGNPKNRQVFLSALNPDQKRNMIFFETVLKRASSGRAAGSPTTPFKEALERMRGVAGVLRDTVFRPVSTAQSIGEQTLFDRRLGSLAKAMFDPQWKPQMLQLRKLDPNSPASARAMTQLLKEIESTETKENPDGNN